MRNNRAEHRIAAKDTGRVIILGHPDVTLPCEIRNFSRSGMCIEVDQAIARGKIVKVDWADHFLVGRVQSITEVDGGGSRIGLELLYFSKWSDDLVPVLAGEQPPGA